MKNQRPFRPRITHKQLAEAIATDLMTSPLNETITDRLAIFKGGIDHGGWSHECLTSRILKWLDGDLTPQFHREESPKRAPWED